MRLRRALATAAIGLLPVLGAGCFAFDEIDSGLEEMKTRSANRKAAEQGHRPVAAAEPEAGGEQGPTAGAAALAESVQASVREWWGNARSIAPGGESNEGVVACHVDGRTAYMLRHECEGRGGRVGS